MKNFERMVDKKDIGRLFLRRSAVSVLLVLRASN